MASESTSITKPVAPHETESSSSDPFVPRFMKPFICEFCQDAFSTDSNKRRHIRRKHQQELASGKRTPFVCIKCEKDLYNPKALGDHVMKCSGVIEEFKSKERTTSEESQSRAPVTENDAHPKESLLSESSMASSNSSSSPSTALVTQAYVQQTAELIRKIHSPIISNDALDRLFQEFFSWLGQPAMTSIEIQVKSHRITKDSQLAPLKANCRFLCNIILQSDVVSQMSELRLALFTKLSSAQYVYNYLQQQKVQHERMYQIFLLFRKILVWMVSKQSFATGRHLSPHILESYTFVDQVALESSQLRKQHVADRLAGIVPRTKRKSPDFIDLGPSEAGNSSAHTQKTNEAGSVQPEMKSPLPSLGISPMTESWNCPSKEEMKRISSSCLQELQRMTNISADRITPELASRYPMYLVLATLCTMSCPRSQVITHMNLGHRSASSPVQNFFLESTGYVIRQSSVLSKDGKPVVLAINELLTPYYTFYIDHLRPLLLHSSHLDQGYVYMGAKNGPKTSFCEWTKRLTMVMVQKAFTPQDFRNAAVTLYYGNKSHLTELDIQQLSTAMNHSADTAKKYYFHLNRADNSQRINREISDMLELGKPEVETASKEANAAQQPHCSQTSPK